MKSDTPEKDRLHTEIFDTVKTIDEKVAVEKGIIGTQYEEEERGGLRKSWRSEKEEEEAEEEEEENTSVKFYLQGIENARGLKSTRSVWLIALKETVFFRQLIADSLHRLIIPQAEEEAEESNPDMDPEEALEVILDERLPELHKMARELLRDQLISIYFIEKCR